MLTQILSVPASKKAKCSLLFLWGFLRIRCGGAHTLHWWLLVQTPNSTTLSLKMRFQILPWRTEKILPSLKNPALQEIQVLARKGSAGSTKEAIASLTPSGEERLEQLGGWEIVEGSSKGGGGAHPRPPSPGLKICSICVSLLEEIKKGWQGTPVWIPWAVGLLDFVWWWANLCACRLTPLWLF